MVELKTFLGWLCLNNTAYMQISQSIQQVVLGDKKSQTFMIPIHSTFMIPIHSTIVLYDNPCKNSQAVKNGAKTCKLQHICGHFLVATFYFTTKLLRATSFSIAWLFFFLHRSHFFLYGIKGPNANLQLSLSVISYIFTFCIQHNDRDCICIKMHIL